ncbi:MAG: hypothetical protein KJ015_31180 [Myxococcales bacterium]|nr:hypothetical protein [Myxococcales bacterium]
MARRTTTLRVVVMVAAACAASPTPPAPRAAETPKDPHHLAPLARRIVARVAALGERFPSMRGASPELWQIYSIDTSRLPWQERFEARWDHEHGASWEPDPTYVPDPHSARSPYRSRLDPEHGLRLTLWLYEGAWLGLSPVTPVEIGRLRVVVFLDAPNPALRAALDAAIAEILESERAGVPSP